MDSIKFKDPIHGEIRIEEGQSCLMEVLKTPAFQRLRKIRQTGLAYLTYPSMNHTRFEHSLGVCHLTNKYMENIFNKESEIKDMLGFLGNNDEIDVTATKGFYDHLFKSEKSKDSAKKIMSLAALVHDIGHAPLSHTAEDLGYFEELEVQDVEDTVLAEYLETRKSKKELNHEDMSIYICDDVFKEITDVDPKEKHIIYAIINESFRKYVEKDTTLEEKEKLLLKGLSPILNGGLDLDKLDYLQRDSYFSGVPYGKIDGDRILNHLLTYITKNITADLVISSYIIPYKVTNNIDQFLFSLFSMYHNVYYHNRNNMFEILLSKKTIQNKPKTRQEFIETNDYNFFEKCNMTDTLEKDFYCHKKTKTIFRNDEPLEKFYEDNGYRKVEAFKKKRNVISKQALNNILVYEELNNRFTFDPFADKTQVKNVSNLSVSVFQREEDLTDKAS